MRSPFLFYITFIKKEPLFTLRAGHHPRCLLLAASGARFVHFAE